MRRCPEEDDQEQKEWPKGDAAGRRDPADHRRNRTGSPANDDVLGSPALEPHGVDEDVESDGEGKKRRGKPIHEQTHDRHRKARERYAESKRLAGSDAALRDGSTASTRHHCIDIGVVPHVERAGGAGSDRNAYQRRATAAPAMGYAASPLLLTTDMVETRSAPSPRT